MPGNPKKATLGLYMEEALLEKIKDVAVHAGQGLNEVVSDAFRMKIAAYEKQIGGPVPKRASRKLKVGRKIGAPKD